MISGNVATPESTGSIGNTIILLTTTTASGVEAKSIKQRDTSNGLAIETKKGDSLSGVTSVLPGSKLKGVLESDPITVFEVEADDDGNAVWAFEIPDEVAVGEHTLYLSGVSVEGKFFTEVLPVFIEEDTSLLPTLLPSAPVFKTEDPASTTDPVNATETAAADPIASTTGEPLAHTGFEARWLAMLGLWLVFLGSSTLTARRVVRVRRSAW